MKTIQVGIIASAFLIFLSPAAEQADGGAEKAETKWSVADDPSFRVMKSPAGEAYFPKGKESYYTRYYRAANLPSMQFKREEKGRVRFPGIQIAEGGYQGFYEFM